MRKISKKEWEKIEEVNKIGLETLTILRFCAFHIDEKQANNTTGLFKILDLVDKYHDHKIKAYTDVLKLKIDLYGKEYLRECMELTIKLYSKMDMDIFKELGIDSKKIPALTRMITQ